MNTDIPDWYRVVGHATLRCSDRIIARRIDHMVLATSDTGAVQRCSEYLIDDMRRWESICVKEVVWHDAPPVIRNISAIEREQAEWSARRAQEVRQ